ncbi:MAG: transglycosylase domain-containing protein, partial [Spirochaetales bacterium]|nr:transglycosylase domain-containing protein [Spirochaetales bacterium]
MGPERILAGHIFADRTEITLQRKLKELWWAIRLEQALSKQEILELYLNEMYFGHNTYGVEEAAQFYFRRPVREASLAEAVMLVIQLASPGRYSPFNNPNAARNMQRTILDQMVSLGHATSEEADRSLEEYCQDRDHSRSHIASAWFDRRARAPYFSEYIRQQLETRLVGSLGLYRAGLEVHTTLDLALQEAAEATMERWLVELNEKVRLQDESRLAHAYREVVPVLDLLSLSFNIEDIRASDQVRGVRARDRYLESLNHPVDLLAMTFGLEGLKSAHPVGIRPG